MRKVKIITVEGRGEVTVKEVTPFAVLASENNEGSWLDKLKALANDAVSPPVSEILTWYPSEQEEVLDAFMEINRSFFSMARKLKVEGLLNRAIEEMANNFQLLFVELSKAGMDQLLGTTAGPSSSSPSNP